VSRLELTSSSRSRALASTSTFTLHRLFPQQRSVFGLQRFDRAAEVGNLLVAGFQEGGVAVRPVGQLQDLLLELLDGTICRRSPSLR
jgi:hypothetical protein